MVTKYEKNKKKDLILLCLHKDTQSFRKRSDNVWSLIAVIKFNKTFMLSIFAFAAFFYDPFEMNKKLNNNIFYALLNQRLR